MSYLPRMSKTYKEPEERNYEDTTKITFNSIPIASALPDDKAYNPQTVLKQYNFYPHPPPQLPGPSLIEEAEQNEKVSIEAKRRRTREEESFYTPDKENAEEFPYETESKTTAINVALAVFKPPKTDNAAETLATYMKATRTIELPNNAPLECSLHGKEINGSVKIHSVDEIAETKAKETESISSSKSNRMVCNTASEIQNSDVCQEITGNSVKHFDSAVPSDESKNIPICGTRNVEAVPNELLNVSKSLIHQGVQCYPYGLNEKIFTLPSSVRCLMRTLSFLVQELDKNEENDKFVSTKEVKKLLNQINETIVVLLGCRTDLGYTLQASVSDSKRLEKIHSDLQEYIKIVYGERGKFGCKSEEKKEAYCKLSQKDYELKFLNEKLRQGEIQNPNLKFQNCTIKSPEVVLQNKNLENEQLTAEIEFNNEELNRFQQALAEKNWEIHNSTEEIVQLKKKLANLKSKYKK